MLASTLPNKLFGLELTTQGDPVSAHISRVYAESFEMCGAQLGEGGTPFILAVAKEPPTLMRSRRLCEALKGVDSRPVAICWDAMDPGMMVALASGGIAYIRDSHNAYLPFLGAMISAQGTLAQPKALSPQAQRIVLNLIAGNWDKCTAGDLAELTGKSAASVTKYLVEIEAIAPGLVETRGRLRVLSSAERAKEDLLRGFGEYLSDPAESTIRLKHALSIKRVRQTGGLLAGESALSFVSDLAPSPTTSVAIPKESLGDLKAAAGKSWQEAAWYEPAEMIVEVWRYTVDAPSDISVSATGLQSIDALNLYIACLNRDNDDVRYLDAVEQLREEICR